jgi:hypothetical protein
VDVVAALVALGCTAAREEEWFVRVEYVAALSRIN